MKTARPKFSELKMQAVFSWKNKGLSRFYDQKFPQSYATSRDGITRPDKCRSQSHCPYWQMLVKSWTGKYFQTLALTSWFTLQTVLSKWQTNSLVIVSLSNNPSYPLKETPSPSGKSGENQYTIEVIKDASSPAIFSKLRAFVIFNLLSKLLKFHSENRCQV